MRGGQRMAVSVCLAAAAASVGLVAQERPRSSIAEAFKWNLTELYPL
jgi:hypothetical protein